MDKSQDRIIIQKNMRILKEINDNFVPYVLVAMTLYVASSVVWYPLYVIFAP